MDAPAKCQDRACQKRPVWRIEHGVGNPLYLCQACAENYLLRAQMSGGEHKFTHILQRAG